MLSAQDRAVVAERFGADESQIERDHIISHLLAGLSQVVGDDVVFFGGTALSRTHLPAGRLSEDIDLYTRGNRGAVAGELTTRWPSTVRREYPRLSWRSRLEDVRDAEPALLVAENGATVRVQLLKADATYLRWPTEKRPIETRYSDVDPAELIVPTLPAFVAMKGAAWRSRHTARDLFDLAALADCGWIDEEAVVLLRDVTGVPLVSVELERLPRDFRWQEQLAHQCRLELDANTARAAVRDAWGRAAGW
jgi:predicted nucleotidyltransferase component of viral defense system